MAASSTTGLSARAQTSTAQRPPFRASRRRQIDPASGRALEILGHAIEYLTDELVHNSDLILVNNPQVEAVQLLMAINREIYFSCPEVKTFGERCRALLHFRSA